MTLTQRRLREQLQKAIRVSLAGGRPRIPDAGRMALRWFADLNATRTYTMGGPNPIGYGEIEAYARLHRLPLEPRHVDMIRAMDEVWLHRARTLRSPEAQPRVTASAQAMTPAAFDAVFG